jgi:hypothetical protein
MPNTCQIIAVPLASLLLACSTGRIAADEMRPAAMPRTGSDDGRQDGSTTRVVVTIDFARVLAFAQPARTIIIGNPGIVDGTLSDDHTIVLTGKSVGVTNLIVLGEGGTEVLNTVVSVTSSNSHTTTIYSGAALNTFSCADSCKPVLSVGDERPYFNRVRDQIKERQDLLGGGAPAR